MHGLSYIRQMNNRAAPQKIDPQGVTEAHLDAAEAILNKYVLMDEGLGSIDPVALKQDLAEIISEFL